MVDNLKSWTRSSSCLQPVDIEGKKPMTDGTSPKGRSWEYALRLLLLLLLLLLLCLLLLLLLLLLLPRRFLFTLNTLITAHSLFWFRSCK